MATAKQLAMRDPALAAMLGAIGNESDFGAEFGEDFNGEGSYFGAEFGSDYGFGAEFGDDAAVLANPASAHPAAVVQSAQNIVAQQRARAAHSQRRNMLLEPNSGSSIKVERYTFAINQTLTLGTPVALSMSGQPDTTIRPQRVTMNAPAPGFATISELKVANVSVTVGGTSDAYEYNPLGVGQSLDMPTLSPANRATLLGNYTGYVPPGFVAATSYIFVASFKGPASIVA